MGSDGFGAVLRFRSTNQAVNRRVDQSFEYHGVQWVEGHQIMVALGAANHDPRRFADPDHFNIDANRGSHLAFGFGPHYCLGAALARAQLQEALRALSSRLECPVVDGATQHPVSGSLMGPTSLELSLAVRESQPTH